MTYEGETTRSIGEQVNEYWRKLREEKNSRFLYQHAEREYGSSLNGIQFKILFIHRTKAKLTQLTDATHIITDKQKLHRKL